MNDFFRSIKSFLKTISRSNTKVMALCILGATTFWFFNALNKADYEATVNYPVELKFKNDSTVVVGELPDNISLQVNGGGWDLLRTTLGINKEPIQIPIQNPTEQKFILTSSVRDIIADEFSNLRILRIITDTLAFDIQNFKEKSVYLDLDSTEIQFKPLFYFGDSILLNTRYLKYSGPESMVDSIPDTIQLSLSYEEPLDEDYEEAIEPPYTSDLVLASPEEINVAVRVKKANQIQKMVPFQLENFPEEFSPSKEKIAVTYYFLKDRTGMDSSDIVVELNYDSLTSDSTIIPRIVEYPQMMKILSYDSSEIEIVKNEKP
ncbi:hypothetical protein OO013_12335 [Mangrovivirga sp. M17]|uniref:YbbR-like domain-containing protein n=1 Tax=Mangrovivirga halotolerans TaxID=2993936 RepID=A0ABT3RSQ2_9BACT|nr:hypothetical protein [Mangrovivirga halotolerans]MCX2744661.1 hypothetical protein [Mangrovivirga halotolerans]